MSVINTNITSMIGQSNLSKSQNALQTSMERLSSGLRINSAKDDAAGQAIANRMTSQITGLAQAQRNANDGISVAQTAEGALNQVNDNLQRIRELSVQAANGTNSAEDKQSIQDEINQRLGEIDRISKETSFNGVQVLGSDEGVKIQVGANDGEAISVNLQTINAETLNLKDFNVNGQVRDAKAATSDLIADSNFVLNASDGSFTTTENRAATSTEVNQAVSAGDLVDIGGGDYATDVVNDRATSLNFASEAASSDTIAIDGTNYVSNGTTFDTSTTESYADAQSDLLSRLDFSNDANANGLIEISGTDAQSGAVASMYVNASGELYTDSTATTRLQLDADGSVGSTTDATIQTFLEGGTGSGAVINLNSATSGNVGDITYTDGGSDVTVAGNFTTTEVAGLIDQSSSSITATLNSTAYTIDANGEVTDSSGDAVYYDSGLARLTTATGGATASADVYSVDAGTGKVTLSNSEVTDAQVFVDADKSGLDALTTDDGGEEIYHKITDADNNFVEYNSAKDGSGKALFVDSNGVVSTDEFSADADAVTTDPLAALDSALEKVDTLRSELGAVQNRFESAITNLQTNETNLSAARSRIEDADYATEVANMTRAQILQQAGTSVLAQANQIPQNVLSLLG